MGRQLSLAICFKMFKHINYSIQSQLKFLFTKLAPDLALILLVKKYFKMDTDFVQSHAYFEHLLLHCECWDLWP